MCPVKCHFTIFDADSLTTPISNINMKMLRDRIVKHGVFSIQSIAGSETFSEVNRSQLVT